MLKFRLFILFLTPALSVAAKDNGGKDDSSFKIVSIVFLVAAAVLAVRKLKGTYKK